MAGEKKKFEELVLGNFVQETIAEVKKNFDSSVLTENEWERVEKKVMEKVTTSQTQALVNELVAGNSVEFKNVANIYPHESTVRLNDKGNPSRKLSIKTRTQMAKYLNE